uniref:Elongation of very long chain fatty acids protein n=1 Tax=Panagrolaimus sp. JU765 TaxID=591449 RepID=A0AC34QDJ1_9BILA
MKPALWTSPYGSILYIPYEYKNPVEKEFWNPFLAHRLFHKYWTLCFVIVAVYIATIYGLARFMKNRQPFTLKKPLIVWNSCLALFSMIATYRLSQEASYVSKHANFNEAICYSMDPREPAAFWACLFALSKIAELFDTVFLVLRKRPLIFLHWYHHAVVLVYTWHSTTELTAAGRWFIFMNFAVHSVMYSYYALTSMGFKIPRLLAASVTALQTTQMLVGVYLSVSVASFKWNHPEQPCQQSVQNLCICFFIYGTFAYLFMQFFKNTYLSKSGKQKKSE